MLLQCMDIDFMKCRLWQEKKYMYRTRALEWYKKGKEEKWEEKSIWE